MSPIMTHSGWRLTKAAAGDAASVRQNLASLAAEQLGEKDRAGGRIEVLPVQWRKHLNLDVCHQP